MTRAPTISTASLHRISAWCEREAALRQRIGQPFLMFSQIAADARAAADGCTASLESVQEWLDTTDRGHLTAEPADAHLARAEAAYAAALAEPAFAASSRRAA